MMEIYISDTKKPVGKFLNSACTWS